MKRVSFISQGSVSSIYDCLSNTRLIFYLLLFFLKTDEFVIGFIFIIELKKKLKSFFMKSLTK